MKEISAALLWMAAKGVDAEKDGRAFSSWSDHALTSLILVFILIVSCGVLARYFNPTQLLPLRQNTLLPSSASEDLELDESLSGPPPFKTSTPARLRSSQSLSAATPSEIASAKLNGRARRISLGDQQGAREDSDSQHADDELEDSGTENLGLQLETSKTSSNNMSSTSPPRREQQPDLPKRRKKNRERRPSKSLAENVAAGSATEAEYAPIVNQPYVRPPRERRTPPEMNLTAGAAGGPLPYTTEEEELNGSKLNKFNQNFYNELGIPEEEIYERLKQYLVDPALLIHEGFLAVAEDEDVPGRCYILKSKTPYLRDPDQVGDTEEDTSLITPSSPNARKNNSSLNVKADAFVPKSSYPNSPDVSRKSAAASPDASNNINNNVASEVSPEMNSLHRVTSLNVMASEFVPRSPDQPSSGMTRALTAPMLTRSPMPTTLFPDADGMMRESYERKCVRCSKTFYTFENGEFVQKESCYYHWGKKLKNQGEVKNRPSFECCYGKQSKHSFKRGCITNKQHVWSGLHEGTNVITGCVSTSDLPSYSTLPEAIREKKHLVLALDGEMGYTTAGLELIQLTVIDIYGKPLYESLILPDRAVLDFNSRFSGVTSKDLLRRPSRSLQEVQQDMLALSTPETIFIGHALENDLRALKLVHNKILDTSLLFPKGNGRRQSLKSLVKEKLDQEIQNSKGGHNSYEDARACIDLVLWMLREEIKKSEESDKRKTSTT